MKPKIRRRERQPSISSKHALNTGKSNKGSKQKPQKLEQEDSQGSSSSSNSDEHSPVFPTWLIDRPDFQTHFPRFISPPPSDEDQMRMAMEKPIHQRYQHDIKCVSKWILKIPLLQSLGYLQGLELARLCNYVRVPLGEFVFRQGDVGNACYLCFSGQVDIVVNDNTVARLKSGAVFGEVAIEHPGQGRTAGIKAALSDSAERDYIELLEIRAEDYKTILQRYNATRKKHLIKWLKREVDLVEDFSDHKLKYLQAVSVDLMLQPGHVIYSESDDIGAMYFVKSGTVELSKVITTETRHRRPVLEDVANKVVDMIRVVGVENPKPLTNPKDPNAKRHPNPSTNSKALTAKKKPHPSKNPNAKSPNNAYTWKTQVHQQHHKIIVGTLESSDYFGFESILQLEKRVHTAVAKTKVHLLAVNRRDCTPSIFYSRTVEKMATKLSEWAKRCHVGALDLSNTSASVGKSCAAESGGPLEVKPAWPTALTSDVQKCVTAARRRRLLDIGFGPDDTDEEELSAKLELLDTTTSTTLPASSSSWPPPELQNLLDHPNKKAHRGGKVVSAVAAKMVIPPHNLLSRKSRQFLRYPRNQFPCVHPTKTGTTISNVNNERDHQAIMSRSSDAMILVQNVTEKYATAVQAQADSTHPIASSATD